MGQTSFTTSMRALNRTLLLYFSTPIMNMGIPSLTIYYNIYKYRSFSVDYAGSVSKSPGLAFSMQFLRYLCFTFTIYMNTNISMSLSASVLDAGISIPVYSSI
jgi:hypothetical protein